MKDIKDLLQKGKPGGIASTLRSEQNSAIEGKTNPEAKRIHERNFAQAYRLLFSYGFVSFEPDSTDYRLWEQACTDLTTEELLHGARSSIDFKGRWFRINDFRALCHKSPQSLPDPHAAYIEACMAGSPKESQPWTHPAVYHAGKACGWTFLAGTAESQAFPRFAGIYEDICKAAAAGQALDIPVVERIEHKPEPSTPDSPQYQQFKSKMKNLLNLEE